MNVLKPQQVVPPLTVLTTSGKKWTLNERSPQKFTMLVYYRGYHCNICKKALRHLHRYLNDFEDLLNALPTIVDGDYPARGAD